MKFKIFLLLCFLAGCITMGKAQTVAPNPTDNLPEEAVYPVLGYYGNANISVQGTDFATASFDGPASSLKIVTDNETYYSIIWVGNLTPPVLNPDETYGYDKLHLTVYAEAARNFVVATRSSDWGAIENKTFSLVAGWNVLEMDLTVNTDISLLRFEPDVQYGTSLTYYVDHIYFSRDEYITIPKPTVEPSDPSPTRCYESLYSDAPNYGSLINYPAVWGGYVFREGNIDGNNHYGVTAVYNAGGYLELNQPIDASSYQYLHLDIWANQEISSGQINIELRDSGDNSSDGVNLIVPASKINGWYSIEIPVASFNDDAIAAAVQRLALTSYGTSYTGAKNFFIDNVYFYTPETPGIAATNPTLPVAEVTSIYSDYYGDMPGASLPGIEGTIAGNKYRMITFGDVNGQSFDLATPFSVGAASARTKDILNVDIWLPPCEPSDVKIKLSSGTEYTIPANTLIANEWVTLSIEFPYFGSVGTTINKIEFLGTADARIIVDNVYFSKADYPLTAPADPPLLKPCAVLPVYNDNPFGATNNLAWEENGWTSTAVDVSYPSSSETYKKVVFDNTNSNDPETNITLDNNGLDLNSYTYLYFDVWLPDTIAADNLAIRLKHPTNGVGDIWNRYIEAIATSAYEGAFLEAGEWISLKIKLSDFKESNWKDKGIDWPSYNTVISKVKELGITRKNDPGTSIMYIDNVYFYSPEDPDVAADEPMVDHTNPILVYSGTTVPITVPGTPVIVESDEYRKVDLSLAEFFGGSYSLSEEQNVLHLDIWTNPCETPIIKIQVGGSAEYTGEYTILASDLKPGQWNQVDIALSKFRSGTTTTNPITSITLSGTGEIGVDNVYFYYIEENKHPVARIGGTDYLTIKDAVDDAVDMTGNVEIRIIESSYEPTPIRITDAAEWTSLTIYPSDEERTVQPGEECIVRYVGSRTSGNTLFTIDGLSSGKSLTISGKLNNTGAPQSLILKGKRAALEKDPKADREGVTEYLISDANNTIIYANNSTNVTIQDCWFQGGTETERAHTTIYAIDATKLIIKNNHFEDCIFLNGPYGRIPWGTINIIDDTENCEVSGNSFWETDKESKGESISTFTLSCIRPIIKIAVSSASFANSNILDVKNNIIGGDNATGSGMMKLNGSSALRMIHSSQAGTETQVDGTNSVLIEENTIANIDLNYNTEIGVYSGNGKWEATIPGTCAIEGNGGNLTITGNIIRNITTTTDGPNNPSSDPEVGVYGIALNGIYSNPFGNNQVHTIAKNHVSELKLLLQKDIADKLLINGIRVTVVNTGDDGKASKAVIRGNRIVMDYADAGYLMSPKSELTVLSAGTGESSATKKNFLDVYNNIVALSGLVGEQDFNSLAAISVTNTDYSEVSCYNNIVYIQTGTSWPDNTELTINGLLANINGANSSMSVYHNTSFVQSSDIKGVPIALAVNCWGKGDNTSILNVWNNNAKNNNPQGYAIWLNEELVNKNVNYLFDYNNYHSASKIMGHFSFYYHSFDDWKFSNPAFEKTKQQEFHSRFLDPEFLDADDITLTPEGIEILTTNLAPKRFLGGREIDKVGADITGAGRRIYLPTMGAVNTIFTNYYDGSSFADIVPSTTNTNSWEQDIVFAKGVTGDFTLTGDMSVHDIYNDTPNQVILNGNELTVTGYIGLENEKNTVNATATGSTVIYAGEDGADGVHYSSRQSAAAQHIFPNTFVNDQVYNLVLNNNSEYFVLLHGKLDIANDFSVYNPNTEMRLYPNETGHVSNDIGNHLGGLNAGWCSTTLSFSNSNAKTTLPVSAWDGTDAVTQSQYRPYAGQRIPRHGIFNNEVYNLVSNSEKLITYHDTLFVKKDLTISSANNLEIAADKYVKVDGLTTNNAGTSGLTIRAQELDEANAPVGTIAETTDWLNSYLFPKVPRPNATFIFNNDGAVQTSAVEATVEMFSHAARDKEVNDKPRWQYMTSPVSAYQYKRATAGDSFEGVRIRKWTESFHHNYIDYGPPYWEPVWASDETIPSAGYMNTDYTTFPSLAPKTQVNPFEGYELTLDQEEAGAESLRKVLQFTGTLTNADYTSGALSYTPYTFKRGDSNTDWVNYMTTKGYGSVDTWKWLYGTWVDHYNFAGQHILGNPYTAALPISNITFGTDVEASVYLFNTGSRDEWIGDEGISNNSVNPGEYLAVPSGQATALGITTLPTMQGFLVKAGNAANSGITISYPDVEKNQTHLRSSEEEKVYTVIEVEGEHSFDRIWLFTESHCQQGFDNGWDGYKIFSSTGNVQFVTVESDEFYQVSSVDDINNLYLGLRASTKDTQYKMTFNHLNTDAKYDQIYLSDLLAQKRVNVTEDGSTYEFTANNTSNIQRRFKLTAVRGTTPIEDIESADSFLNVYGYDNQVYIDNLGDNTGKLYIYDISGHLLQTHSFTARNLSIIDTRLPKGVYVVKVASEGTNITKTMIF